jgi:uncharacterized protein YgbK (DUF1537 family)
MTTEVRLPRLPALPSPWPEDVLPAIRTLLQDTTRTLVVLDDDPTGTQTVHDVAVVTQWDEATLAAELATGAACFYILTNSRSLPAAVAAALNRELADNLRRASARTGRAFTLVSRSDSTLRGHYPIETDALAAAAGPFDATLIAPYFQAGGRFTIGNVHYVADGDTLVPAADTPFARDATFGYRSSDLCAWVGEKTGGRVRAADVVAVSLDDIRRGGPDAVVARLRPLRAGAVAIINACTPRDIEVVALATLRAEQAGQRFLYRTAASFVAARIGLAPRPLLGAAELSTSGTGGGIVVVGSHVPKSTAQLAALRARHPLEAVELSVDDLLDPAQRDSVIRSRAGQLDATLTAGRDAVLFTSRTLVTGADADASLAIGRIVSESLIAVLRALRTPPRFVIAKGGITSSDVATRALDVRRALVRGQILPGVPVWRLGPESRCPGLDYVVFPGNVGGDSALADAYARFRPPPSP